MRESPCTGAGDERLAVDPNRNATLYFGAEAGQGLWRSTDSGVTWAKVTNFPNPGNYVQDPSNEYTADNQGIVWVTFDKRSGTSGNATQTIYVGVADKQNTVYRTTNGGTSWERIAGQPTGYIAHKGVLDTSGGFLYIATSDTGGPYGLLIKRSVHIRWGANTFAQIPRSPMAVYGCRDCSAVAP